MGRRVGIVQQFLKVFLDIVLWRRGPQDLPASSLLVWLSVAGYVGVSMVQLALLHETSATWFVFLVLDPLLLTGCVWLVLKLYSHPERFQQTAAAVLGTGAVLGLFLYLPLQVLLTALGLGPDSQMAQFFALLLVAVFALVTGRIIKLGTGSSLFTGVAVSLTYFIVINLLLGIARGGGH